jgi:hypothetical protein
MNHGETGAGKSRSSFRRLLSQVVECNKGSLACKLKHRRIEIFITKEFEGEGEAESEGNKKGVRNRFPPLS